MNSFLAALLPEVVLNYRVALTSGLLVSLKFLLWAVGFGFLAGIVLAVAQVSRFAVLRAPVVAIVEIVRNTPLLVQLFWIHFALPGLTGTSTTPERSAAIGIAFSGACYFSEVIRAGIQGVPKGQTEAAQALGLSSWSIWTRIVLPQAIIDTLPATSNTILSLFKATAILSVIAVPELMTTTMRITSRTGDPVTILATMTLIYIAVGGALTVALSGLEATLSKRSTR